MKALRLTSLGPPPSNKNLKFASLKRRKSHLQRRKIKGEIRRLREEMAEISEEQRCLKESQKKVRGRFEELQSQREKLKLETELIAKDSMSIQMRLNLIFKLIKARAQNDSILVAQLTRSLRDLICKPNQ